MNVDFEIKVEEGTNKNFLVFISTELTKKLKFELISTSELEWQFKRNYAELILQHGKNEKESYQVEVRDSYSNRKKYETRYKDRFEPNYLILRFKDIENIESVNDVFDIVNKYAKLITDEYAESDSNDELVDMLEKGDALSEVAATK